MNQPEHLQSNEDIAERIFCPGDLVWSGKFRTMSDIRFLFTRGILPAIIHGDHSEGSKRPNDVCFLMMAEGFNSKARYDMACYVGPKIRTTETGVPFFTSIAVTISRERMLASFPGRLQAIGEHFHDDRWHRHYGFDETTNTVFDIPVVEPGLEIPPFPAEVVLRPPAKGEAERGITPDFWTGIAVHFTKLKQAEALVSEMGCQGLPIIPITPKIIE